MPAGVPAGAISPNQPTALYCGMPASLMVGTCGSAGDRVSPLTASARTEPASTNGTMPAIGPKRIGCRSPWWRSSPGRRPCNGTWTVSFWMPASATNMATAKWLVEPGPPEA